MASKKRRKPQPRAAQTAQPAASAKSSSTTERKPARTSEGVRKEPWSRMSVALLLIGAWVFSIGFNVFISASNSLSTLGVTAQNGGRLFFALTPDPLAMLPAVLILELPVRLLRHERRMGFFETLATGGMIALLTYFIGTGAVNFNAPSVTTLPSSSPSATATTKSTPKPSPTATPTPTPSPSPSAPESPPAHASPSAHVSLPAVASPEPGSAPPVSTQSASDQITALLFGDLAASLLFVLVYPFAYRNFINPTPPAPRTGSAKASK